VSAPGFDIGPFRVGGPRVFLIAEIGVNHNGDFDRALAMIDRAAEAGADCAKFQLRDLDALYRRRSLAGRGDDLAAEYTIDLLRRFALTPAQHAELAARCRARGILYLCTPFDAPSVGALEAIGVPAFKVSSSDLVNLPLVERIADSGRPMLLSTGMSTEAEIRATVAALGARGAAFALLHCHSTYPASFASINLRFMERLRAIHPLVGYSGHERGVAVSLGAVALGACVLERHVTLDRTMEGPDHAASLTFGDFASLAAGVRELEAALGDGARRRMSQGELINRENLGKSLVAARDLPAGHVVTRDDVRVRSPGQGLSPQRLPELVGRRLARAVGEEDFFFASDVEGEAARPRRYRFRRPWGVPIRYHDFARFMERAAPPLVEFHLSYRDLDLDPDAYVRDVFPDTEFTVHAPELFRDSKLMDLAAADDALRAFSLAETGRVVEVARRLKRRFPRTASPVIVANVGGFSMDAPLPAAARPALYARLGESLRALDLAGVRLCPQNMAPFPWHFGGQRHQNLFILADESAEWCRRLGLRMCVDVSHAQLAANHFGFALADYLRTMGPHIAHLHVADAAGVDGEGLQIGEGEIDFAALGRALEAAAPGVPFIPEIWQGHKNGGEGFWIGLDRLEGRL
jgi:N-acetylneuraminate synthase